jgi:hypothetical protein
VSRPTALFTQLSVATVAGTGAVYAWMAWLAEPVDEFAVVNHPWQPATRDLHLLAAPLLVFACGVLWRTHVWERIRSGFAERRRTGIVLALALAPMVASGYLLQVAVDPSWRAVWVWSHGITSALWVATYVAHLLTPSAGDEEDEEDRPGEPTA